MNLSSAVALFTCLCAKRLGIGAQIIQRGASKLLAGYVNESS